VVPPAVLSGLRFEHHKPAAEFGDRVTLLGAQLGSDDSLVRFQHPQLQAAIELPPQINSSGTEMAVLLPTLASDPALGSAWPAGFYTLSLLHQRAGESPRSSNRIAMPLSPLIESVVPASAPAGDVVLTVQCRPQIRDTQEVMLLFGERTIDADSVVTPADPTASTTLIFTVTNAITSATPYTLRLRVDGVDSIPVDFSGTAPQFDTNQQVTIT
jgi:hypothetical protein